MTREEVIAKHPILADVYCGFHPPPGWLPLVDKLCTDLEAAGYTGKVAQVKEKFGTLRFYADDTSEEHSAMIELAEKASGGICQNCGNKAHLRTLGCIQTLCTSCLCGCK